MINEFTKFIDPIKRKIYLMVGRAILTAVKNTGKTQMIQVTGLKDETISDIERMQEYGFESYPESGEAIINFINGNRDHGIVICIHDRENRPTINAGETQVWNKAGNKVYLRADGTIKISDKNGNYIESSTTQWNINGNLTVDI